MINMAWGGFMDEDGSNYLKKMALADKSLKYLEDIKKELNKDEQLVVEKTIQIICDYIENLRK